MGDVAWSYRDIVIAICFKNWEDGKNSYGLSVWDIHGAVTKKELRLEGIIRAFHSHEEEGSLVKVGDSVPTRYALTQDGVKVGRLALSKCIVWHLS